MLHLNTSGVARVVASLALLVAACDDSSHAPPLAIAEYEIKATQIAAVEQLLDQTAAKFDLRPFRKDRGQMAALSEGQEAFFTALYFKDQPVLVATNVGTGTVLHVSANGSPQISSTKVLSMYEEFTNSLKHALALKLRPSAT